MKDTNSTSLFLLLTTMSRTASYLSFLFLKKKKKKKERKEGREKELQETKENHFSIFLNSQPSEQQKLQKCAHHTKSRAPCSACNTDVHIYIYIYIYKDDSKFCFL